MRVFDLIPSGKANAIKRKTLVHLAFCNGLIPEDVKDADRFVRKEIEKERKQNVIINLGTGYFVPTAQDTAALKTYIAAERKRAKTIQKGIKYAENVLEDLEHERIEEVARA